MNKIINKYLSQESDGQIMGSDGKSVGYRVKSHIEYTDGTTEIIIENYYYSLNKERLKSLEESVYQEKLKDLLERIEKPTV